MKKKLVRYQNHNDLKLSHKDRMKLRRDLQHRRVPTWAMILFNTFGDPVVRKKEFYDSLS